MFASAPARRESQLSGLLFLGIAFWALCEVTWNLATDRQDALFRVRLSAPGWLYIGPLFLHLTQCTIQPRKGQFRSLLPWLYLFSTIGVAFAYLTPWITSSVVRTSWGWGYEFGPGFAIAYLITVAPVALSLYLIALDFRRERSPAERRQGPWLLIGTISPLLVSAVTDAALPSFGIQAPRLATTSFALMGLLGVWTQLRFGFSFLTPGTFSHEILATLPDGVALVQGDQRIRRANDGLARLSGYDTSSLTGMSVEDLLVADEQDDGWGADSGSILVHAAVDELECRLVRAEGERIPVAICSAPLRDRQDFTVGIVLVIRDLREVADLRSRLVTAARLAAVGELAAGIAHEINNPIAFVRTNLGQLQGHWKQIRDEFDSDEAKDWVHELFGEGEEMIEESLEGVNRAAEIVRGVQGFSHGGHGGRELADLNALIENVLRMATTQLKGRATIERNFADIPLVLCAPQELKQVFLNLIVNAGHAIGDGGIIRIDTDTVPGGVSVRVMDNGCGIDPEIKERIFDPFFTTKRVGDGTGLGLGIAYQIVRSHGGEMRISSDPGEGATFEVVLPIEP